MKIYTKTGDKGQTSLANGRRISKSDFCLEAYGTADELNSFVGLLRNYLAQDETMNQNTEWIQNKLFNLGAALAQAPGTWIVESDIQQLEQWIDQLQEEVPPVKGFLLPGGSVTISLCHVCRTITRRLERQMSRLFEQNQQQEANDILMCFVNRLSDFWFVLAQKCAKNEGTKANFWKK